ncbi:MAG TPA: NosD domain-containing protein [Gemmatimonadaceae bacterium]|jgi:hypothetical protein|nr:NosD domain-containing protein [Gemmatimonadaceae bacterium]
MIRRSSKPLALALALLVPLTARGRVADAGESGGYLRAEDFPGESVPDRIRAAIAALPAAGGIVDASAYTGTERVARTIALGSPTKRVELRLGSITFVGSDTLFELFDGAKLVGNGHTTLIQADGANLAALVVGRRIADCEIANLTVDGNRAHNRGAGSAIALHSVKRCSLHGLVVRNTVGREHPGIAFHDDGNEDNTVEHTLVEDIGTTGSGDGIYVSGPGNRVLFNDVRRTTDFGIVGESCAGCVIMGNHVTEAPAGIAVGSGVANRRAAANVVEGNVVVGGHSGAWGMISVYRIHGAAPVSTIVRGNVVREVREGHGILVSEAEQVSLEGNLLADIGVAGSSYGILVRNSRDVNIVGGSIDRTGSFGIGIGGSANVAVANVLITDASRSSTISAGVGLDVVRGRSTSISLRGLHVFDRDTVRAAKRMSYCIDFAQGGTAAGVLLDGNLFDDGVNAIGCRSGTVRIGSAVRVRTD